jgi:hypothetical protein
MTVQTGVLKAVLLEANVWTDITGGGTSNDDAGTYFLNIANNNGEVAKISGVYVTDGVDFEERHLFHPNQTIRKWMMVDNIKLSQGWKVFVKSNIKVSVQLFGDRRG